MPEHVWVNTMPAIACLVLAIDLLRAGSGGYAIEFFLDLAGSGVAVAASLGTASP